MMTSEFGIGSLAASIQRSIKAYRGNVVRRYPNFCSLPAVRLPSKKEAEALS